MGKQIPGPFENDIFSMWFWLTLIFLAPVLAGLVGLVSDIVRN